MAKTGEEKSDGLEIISVGILYDGPWDKKYWSSSRGKDRYPYPVGYQAVRTRNGITYKMEILEGLKGPLFRITSTDGQSCSGQTPDITWESFQKKGAAHIKLWHGKRFACKIDGVEFFGFKNQFVQRLLRELAANVSRTAVSSTFCEGASGTDHNTHCTEPCRQPGLLPYSEKPPVRGKRSREHGVANIKSTNETTLKKIQLQDQTQNADVSVSRLRSQRNYIQNHTQKNSSSSSNDKNEIHNNSGILAATVTSKTADEEKECVCSVDFSGHFNEEGFLPKEDGVLIRSDNFVSVVGTIFKEEEPELSSSKQVEKEGETSFQNSSQMVNDLDLCAPDTLDLELDDTFNPKEIPFNGNNELTAACITSEDLVIESHPEEEMVTCTAHASSERSDIDSVGQEITKTMMTVLLPRALPLLKTFTRKKKTKTKPSKVSLYKKRSKEKNNKTDLVVDVASPATLLTENVDGKKQQEKTHTLCINIGSMVPSCGDITSIVPDSFENDQCEKDGTSLRPQLPDAIETDLTTFAQDTCTPETTGLPASIDVLQDTAIGVVETSDVRKNFCHEAHQTLNEGPRRGDSIVSYSALGCTAPGVKKCTSSEENSVHCPEILNEQKGVKMSPLCIQETTGTTDAKLVVVESFVNNTHKEIDTGAGAGKTSCTQIPETSKSTRQCDTPLSESIICRNFRDICAPETCAAGSIDASGNCQLSSSHSLIKRDFSCDEEKVDGKPYNFHAEGNVIISEAALCNTASATSQNQEFVGASNNNGPSDISNPSISREGKYQGCGDKELVPHQDLVEFDVSVSWLLEQGECFGNEINVNRKVKCDSNLTTQTNMKHNSDLDSVFEILGCYIHPMPILMVLLSMKDDEIYICVLCGSLMDKKWTLFIYKTPIQGQKTGYPSFIGYASIVCQVSRDAFGREITLDSSGLQFTPDGQSLVLLNCIKVPCCREGKIPCPCPVCASDCFEKNAVKIVQVKTGYISVVTKLKTTETVRCILVCEPNYLLAAEESEKLHLWVMNSTWSAEIEESYLPTSDGIAPYIVDLKRIPKCSHLVLGHNGFGEFILWNISKRILVSRFSAPSTSVSRFSPISLFTLQKEGVATGLDAKKYISHMNATAKLFLERGETNARLPIEGKDVAIPLLISDNLDADLHGHRSSDCQVSKVGWWRQALLVNNTVIMENVLDSRAAAVGTSAGHGIVGTCDGYVYVWELSTGTILGNLHYFKGPAVSCIATDDSSSGAFAVAGDRQLRVYLHSQRDCTNQQGN